MNLVLLKYLTMNMKNKNCKCELTVNGNLVKKFDSCKDCFLEYPGFKHFLDKNRIAYKQYFFKTL